MDTYYAEMRIKNYDDLVAHAKSLVETYGSGNVSLAQALDFPIEWESVSVEGVAGQSVSKTL